MAETTTSSLDPAMIELVKLVVAELRKPAEPSDSELAQSAQLEEERKRTAELFAAARKGA